MRKPRIWALVADGVRARILRGLEDGTPSSDPPGELVSRSRSQHLRDLMAGKPGRSRSPDRSGRSPAMDDGADMVRHDMQDFARELLARLDSHRLAGELERLAIFAAPDMLGILRAEMPRSLRARVFLERAQNLMPLDETELREVVKAEIQGLQPGATD